MSNGVFWSLLGVRDEDTKRALIDAEAARALETTPFRLEEWLDSIAQAWAKKLGLHSDTRQGRKVLQLQLAQVPRQAGGTQRQCSP
jgi:hypothetical protein